MTILNALTHWGRVTHICVGNLTIIGSDDGLSPGRRQAITWTNVGILLIGPLGTNFSEMLIEIHTFSFKKIHLKMSIGKWRPFCLGLNVLIECIIDCPSLYNWPINIQCPPCLSQCMLYEIGFGLIRMKYGGCIIKNHYFICQIDVFESFESVWN